MRRLSFACLCGALVSSVRAQVTTRVSVSSSGAQANDQSFVAAISASGRYVAFQSRATNLAPPNIGDQIFLHDRVLGTTERVSSSLAGLSPNNVSLQPSVSADGRYVAFESLGSNLVAGDTNASFDVLVRDRQTATTERVSVSSGGIQGDLGSVFAVITPDGRYVAFYSSATNLVPGDTNAQSDVFLRDRLLGTTERVSVATGGGQANVGGDYMALSADGRYVAFKSGGSNLVPGDTNGRHDIFLHDRQTNVTERLSVATGGGQSDFDSDFPSISDDGRFAAFRSNATNLVAGDTNGKSDIFLRDRQSGTTARVSVATGGTQADDGSDFPRITPDGRYVLFSSYATNLVAGDTNVGWDVFLHDVQTAATERVSLKTGGVQMSSDNLIDFRSLWLSLTPDAGLVAFTTRSNDLVSGDTNATEDIFVHDRTSPSQGPYCSGDGSSAACPCGNVGAFGHGCANSIFATGAMLSSTGVPSVSADTVVLTTFSMSGNASLYFQGTLTGDSPFDDGKICLGGVLVRIGVKSVAGGTSSNPSGVDLPISVKGGVPIGGGTRYYQTVYRNADPSFCTPATTNRSNGLAITWSP